MFNRSFRMRGSGTTDVRLHWSLILGCIYLYSILPGQGTLGVVIRIVLTLSIMLSIACHEFGHVLVAQRLGYPTRNVVLWMLGGVAVLEREPSRPRDTILIAAAGPLVNAAIAGMFVGSYWMLSALVGPTWEMRFGRWLYGIGLPPLSVVHIATPLVLMNAALALFNLLPIYPLDGGRILQAALTPSLGRNRADLVALLMGSAIAGGLLMVFSVQGQWLSAAETLLLLIIVGTLNPWFNRQCSRWLAWGFQRGMYYTFHQQDYDRALAYADQQIARGREVAEHLVLRSVILLRVGDLAAAWTAADQSVRFFSATDPQRAMPYNNRGSISLLLGNQAAASADIDEAIRADPTLAHAYVSRGEIARDRGDTDLALTALNTAVEIAPTFKLARYYRAMLRFQLGDLDGSCTDAASVFTDHQPEMLTWCDADVQHDLTNRVAWAQQIVAWAQRNAWPTAPAWTFLGDTLRVNARAPEAVAAYTHALAATPNDALLLLRRAVAHQASGTIDAARADLEAALVSRPTPWTRKRALALLASLTPTPTIVTEPPHESPLHSVPEGSV